MAAVEKRLADHHLRPLVLRGDTDLGRETSVDELAGQLAVCEKMGVKYMFLSPKHTGVSKEVAYERLRRVGDIAKKHGVIVVLETHPDLGTNADAHLETMRQINHPNVRVNFDTGNITFYNKGTDAVTELKKIIDYVATVELKDHNGQYMDWNFPALGKGVVDFPADPEDPGRTPLPRTNHHGGRRGPGGRDGRSPDEAVYCRVGQVHPVPGQFQVVRGSGGLFVGIIELVIMAAMVIFNGVFAGYEIALAAVTVARLQVLVRENRTGAKAALYMKENMEASLAAVQVAITLLGAIAAAIGGAGAAESIKPFLHQTFGLSSGHGGRPGHRPGRGSADALHHHVRRVDAEGLFAAQQGVGLPAAVAGDAMVLLQRLARRLAVRGRRAWR